MKRLVALVLVLGLFAGVAYAHNGMEHVMGTVASISDTTITVTATDGKSQTVVLTPTTKYSRMDTSITPKDIKVGDHVVIHATKKNNQFPASLRITPPAFTHALISRHFLRRLRCSINLSNA